MLVYEAAAMIEAPPERVWAILADGPGLPQWDSGITRIEGVITAGGTFKLWSEASPKRAFSLDVAAFEPPFRMVWKSGMPLGLFSGERTFTLTATADGTAFTVHESFRGVMLPLIRRSMPDLQPSFDKFARGLKTRAKKQ